MFPGSQIFKPRKGYYTLNQIQQSATLHQNPVRINPTKKLFERVVWNWWHAIKNLLSRIGDSQRKNTLRTEANSQPVRFQRNVESIDSNPSLWRAAIPIPLIPENENWGSWVETQSFNVNKPQKDNQISSRSVDLHRIRRKKKKNIERKWGDDVDLQFKPSTFKIWVI